MGQLKIKDLKIGDVFYECAYGLNAKYVVKDAPVYYPEDAVNDNSYAGGWGCVGVFQGIIILRYENGNLVEKLDENSEDVGCIGNLVNFFCADKYFGGIKLYSEPQYMGG